MIEVQEVEVRGEKSFKRSVFICNDSYKIEGAVGH